jgi:dipeptidyl aminopeptidase/acylaminoacyl peptidase
MSMHVTIESKNRIVNCAGDVRRQPMVVTRALKILIGVASVLMAVARSVADCSDTTLTIPHARATAKRAVTIDDVISIRNIDTLNVSADGRRFAIFVRQGDASCNRYRTGWFIGQTRGGALIQAGDGGEVRPTVHEAGDILGDIAGSESRWSQDGRWIVYTLRRNGEVQLWRSRTDGTIQQQLTHNPADVREFAWSEDGRNLYFTVEESRANRRAWEEARERDGYRYDEDIYTFTDFMKPRLWRPPEKTAEWTLTLDSGEEHRYSDSMGSAFQRAISRDTAGMETESGFLEDDSIQPVVRLDGARVWLERQKEVSRILRVVAALKEAATPVPCGHAQCTGAIKRVWWSGDRVVIWRGEGINDRAQAFYAWSPFNNELSTIAILPDDDLRGCNLAADDFLLCVRETPTLPAHVAAVNLRSGSVQVVADVNPEFHNVRLGAVERIEWRTPKFSWNEPGGELAGLYPDRAYGYILYPPDFDPSKKYPVFIDPYVAHGFNRPGSEHPLHVYAANGFVVLNSAFPLPNDVLARLGASAMKKTYSAELDFPHLTMLMESTVTALDTLAARGFIDQSKVGIGGVSHGTFIPLYLVQKHDRIAAMSISSPTWGPHEYYWGTAKIRAWIPQAHGKTGSEDWEVKPEGKGREYWSRIDIADHVDAIEAPILMNLAADETYALIKLIRNLADAAKPYDAYVYRDETHFKWQPAHLNSVMNRNLDWFRFWLQGYEDASPSKHEQYALWRNLVRLRDADLAQKGE